jgi:hypothetical protein
VLTKIEKKEHQKRRKRATMHESMKTSPACFFWTKEITERSSS